MCGIAFISQFYDPKYTLSTLVSMCDTISHRGPDGEGYALFFNDKSLKCHFGRPDKHQSLAPSKKIDALMGHRRLAIQDLTDGGKQPMLSPDGRYALCYNGEIYNFLSLKNELEQKGVQFSSACDTEVLLFALIEWDLEALSKLNGMFSFVFYDRKAKRVVAARDRFGVKPLYYFKEENGTISFASEIKQFFCLKGFKRKLHHQAAFDFFAYSLLDHEEFTFYEGVSQLRGGHYLDFTPETVFSSQPIKWYTLEKKEPPKSFEEAKEEFSRLFFNAVSSRLKADVPVGSCLSGGLDSSSIVCAIHKLLQGNNSNKQYTFSCLSDEPAFDERYFMGKVLEQTNVPNQTVTPTSSSVFHLMDLVLHHQDEPFLSTSIFAQWLVFELAKRNGVKVMLDGQGADEQLGGYSIFLLKRIEGLLRKKQFLIAYQELRKTNEIHQIAGAYKKLLYPFLPLRDTIDRWRRKKSASGMFLNRNVLKAEEKNPHFASCFKGDPLNSLCFLQMTKTNLPQLLRYEDRNSMAHSIEARVPFCDVHLVEFLQSLPPSYKVEMGITKRILRESLKDTLPHEIASRNSKLGFSTAEEVWVKKEAEVFMRMVEQAVEASRGILSQKAIDLSREITQGKRAFSFDLFKIMIFGKWMEQTEL